MSGSACPLPGIVIEPEVKEKVKTLPLWKVIILNDEEHSFPFVIALLMEIFRKEYEEAVTLTMEIHETGQAICEITSKEKAELRQEQVKSKGRDPAMGGRSTGPLRCVIEPAE